MRLTKKLANQFNQLKIIIEMNVIFSLDISTSIIGWSIVFPKTLVSTKPILKGHIDLRKIKGGFWQKTDIAQSQLEKLNIEFKAQGFKVIEVYVEEPLKKFTRGKSSASTISMLARFNALVSFFARQTFGVAPLYIDATHARKKIGIPLLSRKKSGGLSQKEQTANFLCEGVFKDEKWSLNKNGKIQPYHFDEMDAFVIAIAGCMGLGEPA